MKLINCSIIFIFSMLSAGISHAQWQSIDNIPSGPTHGIKTITLNGKGYAAGGALNNSNHFYEYDPETDFWMQRAPIALTKNRAWPFGFVLNDRIFIGGGDLTTTGLADSSFYEYDANLDQWQKRSDFGGGPISSAFSCSVNGKGYVIGGYDGTETKNSIWEYDPSNDKWTKKADYPPGNTIFPSGFVIAGKIYFGLGSRNGMDGLNEFYMYDPATDVWEKRSDFPGDARMAGVGFSINNKGYFGGGMIGFNETFTDFYSYDPNSDKWQLEKSMSYPTISTAWSTAFILNNSVYMGSGANFKGAGISISDEFYRFDFIFSSTEVLSKEKRPSIYPNPTYGQIAIEGFNDIQAIELFNLQGQKIVIEKQQKEGKITLPPHLEGGMYIINVYSESLVITQKILLSR